MAAATIIRGGVLDTHRSPFTAWRRPIGQEKRPSGNYWTNSRSDLAKPKLSDYGVAAMSRRFPSTAQASNVQKREGVGWATDLKVPTSLARRSGGRLRHIGSGPNQRTSSISI